MAGVLDLDFFALLLEKAVQFWQLDVSNGGCASECYAICHCIGLSWLAKTQSCQVFDLVPELHSSFTITLNTWLEPWYCLGISFFRKIALANQCCKSGFWQG